MASGIENLQGYGEAQIFPRGKGYGEFLNNLNEQRQFQFQRERQTKLDQEKKDNELYSLIGNELNPRDFNAVIHYKVKKAQEDLASQIIANKNLDYGQMYLMAHNKAAELGQVSDVLNRVDQQLALTKKEYEGDKRINSGAVEIAARKNILDQIKNGQIPDESINYFDKILNENPNIGLVDQSDATFTDFLPEEKQPLKFNVRKRNPVGKTMQYSYDFENYPAYYDVQQKGDFESPAITVRSQPSGIKDASGNEQPMLSDDAYKRFSIKPSNVVALNRRIVRNNPGIDLSSQEAEKLRKVEAYKDVAKFTPVPRESRTEQQPVIHINTGSGSTKNAGADWVDRATKAIQGGDQTKIEDEFSQLFQGDKNKYVSSEIKDGKLKVIISPAQRYDLQGKAVQGATDPTLFEEASGGIDINDKFLPQKLARLWQTVMGSDVQTERKKYEPQKAGTYSIRGKDYSEEELLKMGYTIDDIKPYKK